MWIKLGSDYLNLDHVVRVRFNKGWKNGNEELVAEVEGLVKGDVQVFTRYRSHDAEVLQAVLGTHMTTGELVPAHVLAGPHAPAPASTATTLHDL